MRGTLHVPGRQSLVDFLAPGTHIVKVSRVRMLDEEERLPFVGFRRDAIQVIEPTQADELVDTAGSAGRTAAHRIGCLLHEGTLLGTVDVLVNVRVSDFLRQQPGLVVLRDCLLAPYGRSADSGHGRRMPCALVNFSRVLGVAEWENPQV